MVNKKNPSKSKVRIASKHYFNSFFSTIADRSDVNQWSNTDIAIKWFTNLRNKSNIDL